MMIKDEDARRQTGRAAAEDRRADNSPPLNCRGGMPMTDAIWRIVDLARARTRGVYVFIAMVVALVGSAGPAAAQTGPVAGRTSG